MKKQFLGVVRSALAGAMILSAPFPHTASAQTTTSAVGTITGLYLSGGYNYAFRVYIGDNGANQMTGCPYGFAYLNIDNTNYQAIAAFLLSSHLQRQRVSVSYAKDANGFCQISDAND